MSDNTIGKFYKLILAALVAGSLIFHLAILWESRHRIAAGYGDFIIFYTGAQIINDGKSKDLFNVETQNAYQAKFDVPQLEWPLPFNHAPYELFLFLPLAHLPYPVAHAIWSVLNLILLLMMLRWLVFYVHSPHNFFVCAAVLAWFPTMEAFRLGQDSILSAALLLAVFIALKRGADGWAGVFLALGLYKPQLVLPMAGAFLVARRWHTLAVFSITGGVLAAVSLAMVGWQGALDLIAILESMGDYSFIIYPRNMPNIRGLSHVLLQAGNLDMLIGPVTVVLSLGIYGLCLYLWRGEHDVLGPSFDMTFSLTIVSTVLIGYHLYSHDLFPLMLPLVLFFRYISSESANDWASRGFFFLLIILFLPMVPRYLIDYRSFGWGAIPVLILYMVLSLEIFRRSRIQRAY
jgi:hypothetical protein